MVQEQADGAALHRIADLGGVIEVVLHSTRKHRIATTAYTLKFRAPELLDGAYRSFEN